MTSPKITPLRTAGRAPRVLTIDVEDWFHVCGDDYYSDPRRWDGFVSRVEKTMRVLLERLENGGHRATLFFLGWVARRYPDLVREAVARGHEIGVHGDSHRRADEMTVSEFREDLLRSRETIEMAAGGGSRSYRAAEWSIRHASQPALEVLASEGFACDASMTAVPYLGRNGNPPGPHRIDFGGRSLVEVPPLTGRGFGRTIPMGGAWPFRMFSRERLRAEEDRFREAGLPAVFTFHPWEFDGEHPAMEGLDALLRLVHFYNLRGLPEKFERWLAQERCVALADVLPLLAA
ncbi:MAG TPA: polysaccharide deacetylase family protein [Thermoanaerobaculia bacterium]|jgi:polysaccharide deacetylase family protein (PEP-CTERM system associated)|nr:polysaccharide deacetylase family protein [Thermoanaerobaculia bacterium]